MPGQCSDAERAWAGTASKALIAVAVVRTSATGDVTWSAPWSPLATEHRGQESGIAEKEDAADHEAEQSGDARDGDVEPEVASRAQEPERACECDRRVGRDQPDEERHEQDETTRLSARACCRHEDEHLGGCLCADAVDHSDAEGRSRRVVSEGVIGQRDDVAVPVSMVRAGGASSARAHQHDDVVARSRELVRMGEIVGIGQRVNMIMVDLEQFGPRSSVTSSEPTDATSHSAEHQHPATTHPELAAMVDERVEDVATQEDEGRPHEPFHGGVDTVG